MRKVTVYPPNSTPVEFQGDNFTILSDGAVQGVIREDTFIYRNIPYILKDDGVPEPNQNVILKRGLSNQSPPISFDQERLNKLINLMIANSRALAEGNLGELRRIREELIKLNNHYPDKL